MTGRSEPDPHLADVGAYVLGALEPSEQAAFERHLTTCPRCSQEAAALARLPALLSLVSAEVAETLVEEDGEVGRRVRQTASRTRAPAGLIEGVISRARAEQTAMRRRRWLTLAAAAAVAVLVAATGLVVTMDGPSPGPAADDVQVLTLEPVSDGPLEVTARLVPVAWGTRIELDCRYSAGGPGTPYATPPVYALVISAEDGETEQVSTWRAVVGRDITVEAASAVPHYRIAALEVQTAGGRTVLRADR